MWIVHFTWYAILAFIWTQNTDLELNLIEPIFYHLGLELVDVILGHLYSDHIVYFSQLWNLIIWYDVNILGDCGTFYIEPQ